MSSKTFSIPVPPLSLTFIDQSKNGVAIAQAGSTFTLTDAGVPPPPPGGLSPEFFGMDLGVDSINSAAAFPTVPFGSIRPSDPGIQWKAIEPSRGNFNFARLNQWLALAGKNKQSLYFTLGHPPSWARGANGPPSDIGSGNTAWKEFVTAAVKNSLAQPTPVKFYEILNEADHNWGGTPAQLVTMARDALAIIHALDPKAIVVAPSVSSLGIGGPFTYLENYAAAGGFGKDAQDAISLHFYPSGSEPSDASYIHDALTTFVPQLMAKYGISAETIYFSEGAWNGSHATTKTMDQQVATLQQMYLFMAASGVKVGSAYWFQWDNQTFGTMYKPGTGILPTGVAYGELYSWLVGSTLTPATQASDGTWTVGLTRADGTPAKITWKGNSKPILS